MSSVTLFMNSCWQGAFRQGTLSLKLLFLKKLPLFFNSLNFENMSYALF